MLKTETSKYFGSDKLVSIPAWGNFFPWFLKFPVHGLFWSLKTRSKDSFLKSLAVSDLCSGYLTHIQNTVYIEDSIVYKE